MNRSNVHLPVFDLDQSVGFLSSLFGTPPARPAADPANWMLEDPSLSVDINTWWRRRHRPPAHPGEAAVEAAGT